LGGRNGLAGKDSLPQQKAESYQVAAPVARRRPEKAGLPKRRAFITLFDKVRGARLERLTMSSVSTRLGVLCLAVHAACAGGFPVLSETGQPFSFAVLGDLHLSRPAFEARQTVDAIAAAAREAQPPLAFVCQTGDLAHGEAEGHKQLDRAGMVEELTVAVGCVTQSFGAPLFVAVGNHDKHAGGAPYRETVLPALARQLNAPLAQTYYAFRYGNACFIFLDYGDYSKAGTGMDYAAQRRFLEETLAQARADPGIRHVFAFGHYPLWPVVRPGFGSDRFTASVVPAFVQTPVDAYFCGHTHNSGAWVRRVDGVPVTQIKGVAMDKSAPLRPMEESRTSLIPRAELDYGWGVLSGPTNGFYLVSVEGPRVRVQFRSGRTVLREFAWQEPGKISDTVAPAPRPAEAVTDDALRQAAAATLVFTPWTEMRAELSVLVNGEKVGDVRLDPMPHWAAYATETRIKLPPESLKRLRAVNEIVIQNPGNALFGLGNVRLDVKLAGGATVRSAVADRFWLSAEQPQAAARHSSTLGWEIIPPGVLNTVKLGEPLGPISLAFPR